MNPAKAVELANGLIIQFREDDAKSTAEKEAARAARSCAPRSWKERPLRGLEGREALMAPDQAPPEGWILGGRSVASCHDPGVESNNIADEDGPWKLGL